jgi:hypothetical protein
VVEVNSPLVGASSQAKYPNSEQVMEGHFELVVEQRVEKYPKASPTTLKVRLE